MFRESACGYLLSFYLESQVRYALHDDQQNIIGHLFRRELDALLVSVGRRPQDRPAYDTGDRFHRDSKVGTSTLLLLQPC